MGVSITHVPYRGLGPAMQDLMAGRVDYMCDSPSTSLPQIEANMVKAIAATGQQRATSLPNVPTAQEQGLNFNVTSWQGPFPPIPAKASPNGELNAFVGHGRDISARILLAGFSSCSLPPTKLGQA
jgi:tripartite-type tricarboxylate transporter receptor subunit TctC